ncbi:GTPase IMAP family member 7-like [Micropterus dolomieu]|uniref:GTPase IMAP family member 7-like n=1 Tax=Micropterus dolomieu TaxID=147949 RepID=UPI001E8E88A0|nr:GTPase IMAP family member 7-like [Micropterus dolomieu]
MVGEESSLTITRQKRKSEIDSKGSKEKKVTVSKDKQKQTVKESMAEYDSSVEGRFDADSESDVSLNKITPGELNEQIYGVEKIKLFLQKTKNFQINSVCFLSSVTGQCCKQKGLVFGRELTVIDTPGLFDTSESDHTVKREIAKCINMSAPFTAEERDAVRKVEEVFGKDAWKNTIILFTYGDRVESDFERQLEEAGPELLEILRKAGNRYHVFNNLKANHRRQVLDLLEKVEQMVAANGGGFYSNYTYQQVVEMLDQREAELREFYQKKLEEEIKAVESEYEKKLSEAQQERHKVEERLQSELQEVKRYYHALESGVRQVVEQIVSTDSKEDILKFHETLKLSLLS